MKSKRVQRDKKLKLILYHATGVEDVDILYDAVLKRVRDMGPKNLPTDKMCPEHIYGWNDCNAEWRRRLGAGV